jgi:hypothetical protein
MKAKNPEKRSIRACNKADGAAVMVLPAPRPPDFPA